MAGYNADGNKVAFITESGTYGVVSGTGVWPGLVTSHDLTTELNVEPIRYEGSADRNVDIFVNGGEDHEGSLTLHPQDFRFLAYALGSVVDAGSPSPYTHSIKEADSADVWVGTSGALCPFASFTLEDSQTTQNVSDGTSFIRTLNGCMVNTYNLSIDEGGIAEVSVDYISQSNTFSSGIATTITANTSRPFLWQDVTLSLPSGTALLGVKSVGLTINNNLERRHYMNGSVVTDVPVPLNRDYELTATLDGTSEQTKALYDQYFRGGSTFNCILEINDASAGAGSRTMMATFSGCRLFPLDAMGANEGTNEQELTIVPKSCSVEVTDLIQKYAPW